MVTLVLSNEEFEIVKKAVSRSYYGNRVERDAFLKLYSRLGHVPVSEAEEGFDVVAVGAV